MSPRLSAEARRLQEAERLEHDDPLPFVPPSVMTRARIATVALALCVSACGPGRSAESESESESGTDESAATTDATESVGDEAEDTGTSETSDEVECLLAIRIDLCCNQPYPASADELATDPCVVAWPIDWAGLPSEVVSTCTMAQPQWCELVDCDYAEPASETVEPDAAGGCQYVCPIETYLAYRNPGCGEPPSLVECLGTPPPCADEYCSCTGETIFGCGQVSEPFSHVGPCD
jgi:hypothetical protein